MYKRVVAAVGTIAAAAAAAAAAWLSLFIFRGLFVGCIIYLVGIVILVNRDNNLDVLRFVLSCIALSDDTVVGNYSITFPTAAAVIFYSVFENFSY